MGKEALNIPVRFADGTRDVGRLQWEAPRLVFRGAARRVFEGEALAGLSAQEGDLALVEGTRFTLGAVQAARWAGTILNPPGRLDKLGVKPGLRIGLLAIDDPAFVAELAQVQPVTDDLSELDILFYGADTEAALARIPAVAPSLAQRGALWIVSRKGKAAGVKDTQVFAAARGAGLADTKVCAFSDTHTALRFVRRRKD